MLGPHSIPHADALFIRCCVLVLNSCVVFITCVGVHNSKKNWSVISQPFKAQAL